MEARGDAGWARVGERVEFVRIKGEGESIEDPLHALQREMPLDLDWYVHNQLRQPLLKLFEIVVGKASAERLLFSHSARCAASGTKVTVTSTIVPSTRSPANPLRPILNASESTAGGQSASPPERHHGTVRHYRRAMSTLRRDHGGC